MIGLTDRGGGLRQERTDERNGNNVFFSPPFHELSFLTPSLGGGGGGGGAKAAREEVRADGAGGQSRLFPGTLARFEPGVSRPPSAVLASHVTARP